MDKSKNTEAVKYNLYLSINPFHTQSNIAHRLVLEVKVPLRPDSVLQRRV